MSFQRQIVMPTDMGGEMARGDGPAQLGTENDVKSDEGSHGSQS